MNKDRLPEAVSTGELGLLNMHEYPLLWDRRLTYFNLSNAGLVLASAYGTGKFWIPSLTSSVSPHLRRHLGL